jgi:hypothetical protein
MTGALALLGLLACGDPPPAAPDAATPAWGAEKSTQLNRYLVSLEFEPAKPPMGELFDVVASVKARDGTLLDDAKVTLNALMPQHGHGMATSPIDDPGVCDAANKCRHPNGIYRTSGFKFHMAGDWSVTVDINGSEGMDSTSFVYGMTE